MMQNQAIGFDSSDTPQDRWSIWAHAITGLGLSGIFVAILFLAIGRSNAALLAAIACYAVTTILYQFAKDRAGALVSDGSIESARAANLGMLAALVFLAICYCVAAWPLLASSTPVIFSRSGLFASFWIVLSLMEVIPRAYRIWRTSPPAAQG